MSTKTDSRSRDLLKNTGIIGFGTMCTKALSFLLLPLYTALLSTSDYGTLDLVTTVGGLFVPIVGIQLSQAIFRYVAEVRGDDHAVSTVLTAAYLESLGLIATFVGLFFFVAPFVSLPYKWVLLPLVVFNIMLQLALYSARGIGDNVSFALGSFISASATLVLNVIFLAIFSLGLEGMLAAYCIGPIAGTAIVVIRDKLWQYFKPSLWSMMVAKKLTRYAFPLMPNEVSWWALQSADRVVISTALGTAANGLISVANKFSFIYSTVFSVFNASWTEQVILHYHDEDGATFIRQTVDSAVRFFSALFLVVISALPFIWSFMIDASYNDAFGMVPLYMIAVYANLFTGLVSPIYLVNNESRKVLEATVVSAVVSITVLITLLGPIGVYAAPISTIVGYGLVAIMRVIDVQRRHMDIALNAKILVPTAILATFASLTYICGGLAFKVLCLAFCLVFSIAINRNMIISVIRKLKGESNND